MIILGLDIGSNSVGSAWLDTERKEIQLGVSVFPAGVDEQENKRGAPKNQARREKRSQRRNLARRSARKRNLRRLLTAAGLLPSAPEELDTLFKTNPWHLRRAGLSRVLSPHEFGRVLVHLNQRRGAVGIETDPEDPEEGKVKEGIDRLAKRMAERNAETVGQLIADLMDERRCEADGKGPWQKPVRNRQYRMKEDDQLYADRPRIRDEFNKLWERQKNHDGPLSALLTDDLKTRLDDSTGDTVWRHKGILFGQRRTYWDTGTLGRCDLEPTERCVPLADMYAQEFRVVETVNNIRITERGKSERALSPDERTKVIDVLRKQKTGSVATVRKALGIDKKTVKEFYTLNIERDKDREINTDWFYREVIHGVFTEGGWSGLSDRQRESINRAILKFDADSEGHETQLRAGAARWWNLDAAAVDRLIAAWKSRPKIDKRLKLSRRAIRNLLPCMNEYDKVNNRWPTQIEARERFSKDENAEDRTTGLPATPEQHQRYALGARPLTSADRRYLHKHEEPLPPAPMLSNPVVRKAIHEVRRHIIAWWRKFDRTPDRIVLEYVRSATQPEKVRNAALSLNRKREGLRKRIIEQFELASLPRNQQARAIERVLLCRQQKGMCAYTGGPISEKAAAEGRDVETDHIVPRSRSQDNGLNNKVLVGREANRGKGNATVKEWMTSEQFAALEQHLGHLEKSESPDDYFTRKDCGRKWENLHRDAPQTADFLQSQFTDTAYATRQVGQWLREALYDGERDGQRRVFTSKGSYTSILRNDWGLSESELDRLWHDIAEPGENDADNQSRRARKQKNKDRSDHLHHAIDAACIAFAPDRLQDVARFAAEQEVARAREGRWPRRRTLPPPWPLLPANATPEQMGAAIADFRKQVLSVANALVVSHRVVKQKIIGAFHEETAYGPVVEPLPRHRREDAATLFTNRIQVAQLTPNHLRVPDGWDELSSKLDNPAASIGEKRAIHRQLASIPDPPPSKSGIVRDRTLRDCIRKSLRVAGLDPDRFSKDQMKRVAIDGRLTMPSGVPIKSVVLLRTNNDPVIIPRKRWDVASNRMVVDQDPRTARVYIGGNNHHIEIRERTRRDGNSTEWFGEIVTTFEAARRSRLDRRLAVDRTDNERGRFVMSLAEGEIVHMRHPVTTQPGYFVVFKLDKPNTIHFIHHWDARPSQPRKDEDANEIPSSKREDIAVVAGKLKDLGIRPGQSPYKVRVSPLGKITELIRD